MEDGKFRFLDNTEKLKLTWENGSHGANVYDYDIPLGAEDEQAIRLEVTVTDADPTYIIMAGANDTTPYAWYIDWGDGSPITAYAGYSYYTRAPEHYGTAPRHTYPGAGTYPITITPADTLDAWAKAYGQNQNGDASIDFRLLANRNKLVKMDTLLTPEMSRTGAMIEKDSSPGYSELLGLGLGCSKLKSMGNTMFSRRWDRLTKCVTLLDRGFSGCTSLESMPPRFTLPPGITTVSGWFGLSLFNGCSHPNFAMNKIFNVPQNISGKVARTFLSGLFTGCSGAAFAMNGVFQFPQGVTSTDAVEGLFRNVFGGCSGAGFRVNDIVKFPPVSQPIAADTSPFDITFSGVKAPQTRTAESIINGNPVPTSARGTFRNATGFPDYAGLPDNWK
jgi:hypothetical protein